MKVVFPLKFTLLLSHAHTNVGISGNTTFSGNSASCGGGVRATSSNVYIMGTPLSGGIYTRRTPLILTGNMFNANSEEEGGGNICCS